MKERAEEVCQSSADHTHKEDFFLTNAKRQPPHDTSAGQIGTVLTVCVLAHRCTLGAPGVAGQALRGDEFGLVAPYSPLRSQNFKCSKCLCLFQR